MGFREEYYMKGYQHMVMSTPLIALAHINSLGCDRAPAPAQFHNYNAW